MLKLLIVDDSALMRKLLTKIFEAEGDFEIFSARNGQEAIDANLNVLPDVITLDINMPEIDGLSALAHIMASRPVPVVMVSSLTEKGALATFEALALGAVDYVAKPDGTISLSIEKISKDLVGKVRNAAQTRPRRNRPPPDGMPTRHSRHVKSRPANESPVSDDAPEGLVLIGVSTGGPGALETILPELPAHFPYPVVVAQHMPKFFTEPLAQRLNQLCPMQVVEAEHPMKLHRGMVYIARGGADICFTVREDKLYVQPRPEVPEYRWHPSVELLGLSALEHCEATQLIGVILTGMGCDGAESFTAISRQGGRTIAESEESAVVFGMPRELIEHGGANMVLPVHKIAAQLISWAGA